MAASGAADFGLLEPFADHAAEHVRIEGIAVAGEEQGALPGVEHQARADFVEVELDPMQIGIDRAA